MADLQLKRLAQTENNNPFEDARIAPVSGNSSTSATRMLDNIGGAEKAVKLGLISAEDLLPPAEQFKRFLAQKK